jgi:phosphoglycolate phosphatase
MKLLSKYKHIIWDWNGTLLADQRLSYDIFVEVFESAGKSSPNYEDWRDTVHFPISAFYQSFMPDAPQALIQKLMNDWSDRYEKRRSGCALQPGAEQMLQAFKAERVPQSILSAHTKVELVEAARELSVLHFFEHIAALEPGKGGESKIEVGKNLLIQIESSFNLSRQDHVILGDSSHDAEVANALGIDCILVAQGIFSRRRLDGLGFQVCESLVDLL